MMKNKMGQFRLGIGSVNEQDASQMRKAFSHRAAKGKIVVDKLSYKCANCNHNKGIFNYVTNKKNSTEIKYNCKCSRCKRVLA